MEQQFLFQSRLSAKNDFKAIKNTKEYIGLYDVATICRVLNTNREYLYIIKDDAEGDELALSFKRSPCCFFSICFEYYITPELFYQTIGMVLFPVE